MKPNRRRWELTAADLPTEKAQAAEPSLRDLENNAIFRLCTLRRGLLDQIYFSSKPADVEDRFYRDLRLTLLKPEDYVNGVWGSKVSRRKSIWRMITFWVLVILIAAVVSDYSWLHVDFRLFCAVGLFFLGLPVAARFNGPYSALPSAYRFFVSQRRAVERKARPVAASLRHNSESLRSDYDFYLWMEVGGAGCSCCGQSWPRMNGSYLT